MTDTRTIPHNWQSLGFMTKTVDGIEIKVSLCHFDNHVDPVAQIEIIDNREAADEASVDLTLDIAGLATFITDLRDALSVAESMEAKV